MRGAGTASTVDLTGAGGNLETNQPLPTGAALLTTGFANGDKAEVAISGDFGLASSALTAGTFGYSFYKQYVATAGANQAAAPSLKLSLYNPGGTGDNFGQLIYEPYWNGPGDAIANPTTDAWQSVSITAATGAGGTGAGGWWWSGGFEQPSGAGGPPIRSLAEWDALFTSSDAADYAGARIVGVSMGIGTYNLDTIGYFDNVSVAIPGGLNETYDFQPVPEASQILLGLLASAGFGLVYNRRRNRKS